MVDNNFEAKDTYELYINKNEIVINSATLVGLNYGISSLKLPLFSNKNTLRTGYAIDISKFKNRGIMLDVSRGKMPTIKYLKSLVSFMSDLKYNILQLYCEDKLALKSHPTLGTINGAYTEEQICDLDNFCKLHFIELQPCIQTYSYMYGLLRMPGYTHLAENQVLFSFAAGNESVYELKEVLPWFSSKTLNINMDEAYDIGIGFSKDAVDAEGKGKVFMKHI